ncbi:MAG: protein kinase domain-containing protein [Cuniculiplasma sp.]
MSVEKNGFMERIRSYFNKKYVNFEPTFGDINANYYTEEKQIKVWIKPKFPNYIKQIEVTLRDYKLRDRIYKFKKNGGDFYLSIPLDLGKKYIFSIYSIGKDGKFDRVDYTLDQLNPKVINEDEQIMKSSGPEVSQAEKGNSPSTATISSQFIPVRRSWPSSSQYAQALQNPTFSLSKQNEQLSGISFVKNENVKYGSIIQGAGNFGVVFKFNKSDKFYALKCFTRGSPNIQLRYYEISKKISLAKVPFLVDFKYYESALRVMQKPKEFFPVISMEWLDGKTLHSYIIDNLKNPESFKIVGKNLVSQIKELQQNSIAHGDLSCDNILIDSSRKAWLIDYDGMYVPSLKFLGSEELGHESFQHPRRGRYYGEKLDNFSILIIYTSLMALAKNPKLWKFNGNDPDKLLFEISDFQAPQKSAVFKSLISEGGKVKRLANLIMEFLHESPDWSRFDPDQLIKMK